MLRAGYVESRVCWGLMIIYPDYLLNSTPTLFWYIMSFDKQQDRYVFMDTFKRV